MSKHYMTEIAADYWRDEIEAQARQVSAAYNHLHTEDPPDVHAAKIVRLRQEWAKYRALVETVKNTNGIHFDAPVPPIGEDECLRRWGEQPWSEE